MTYSKNTIAKMTDYQSRGYSIICGNAPYLNKTKKWANYECVRIAQTNSRRHGYSISTVWAVRGDK